MFRNVAAGNNMKASLQFVDNTQGSLSLIRCIVSHSNQALYFVDKRGNFLFETMSCMQTVLRRAVEKQQNI